MPPAIIGTAKLEAPGLLRLTLLRQGLGPRGQLLDPLGCVSRLKEDPWNFAEMLAHVGEIRLGQVKDLRAWPEPSVKGRPDGGVMLIWLPGVFSFEPSHPLLLEILSLVGDLSSGQHRTIPQKLAWPLMRAAISSEERPKLAIRSYDDKPLDELAHLGVHRDPDGSLRFRLGQPGSRWFDRREDVVSPGDPEYEAVAAHLAAQGVTIPPGESRLVRAWPE